MAESKNLRWPVKLRYSDCDANGAVQPVAYLRLMLQAALDADAAQELETAGADAAAWLQRVGDLGLQILETATYFDALEVETRLIRRGPPVWRRSATFSRAGVALAKGFVDTFLNTAYFDRDTEPAEPATPNRYEWDGYVATPPEPPPDTFHGVARVPWSRHDLSGQLDPASLSEIALDMDLRAAEFGNWSEARSQEAGVTWRVIEHRLELFEPIQAGDELYFVSCIGEVGETDFVRHTAIQRGDEYGRVEIARTRTRWACVRADTGQRCDIPSDWQYDFADQMTDV